jgi:hypothetical protein
MPEAPFTTDALVAWVAAQIRFGARRPGSAAGQAAERYLEEQLTGFGLQHVRREPIPIVHWAAETARLEVGDDEVDMGEAEAFPIPYVVFPPEGVIEAPMVWADSRRLRPPRDDWRGKVVVTDIRFPTLPVGLMKRIALGVHDPDDTIQQMDHPATWVRLGWHVYRQAAGRGAAGFVGILRDQPGGTARMYAPYGFREKDILDRPIPGFWVGRAAGRRLADIAKSGSGRARLQLTGVREPGLTHNVVGEIPGETDEVTVLSCHHDSPFVSPVEDGTGVAVVLALAKHFAARHAAGERLRRRLVVVLTAGHFYGSIGTRTFIREHPDLVRRTALEISIEHVGLEAEEDPSGALVATGRPETTGIFVPLNETVSGTVLDCLREHGLDRCVLLPAEGPLGPYPPTDGGDWWEAGVPLINHISNPVYLLTDDDAVHWVDRERLPRVAAAFAAVVERLDRIPREVIAACDRPVYAALMKVAGRALFARTTRFGLHPVY